MHVVGFVELEVNRHSHRENRSHHDSVEPVPFLLVFFIRILEYDRSKPKIPSFYRFIVRKHFSAGHSLYKLVIVNSIIRLGDYTDSKIILLVIVYFVTPPSHRFISI